MYMCVRTNGVDLQVSEVEIIERFVEKLHKLHHHSAEISE